MLLAIDAGNSHTVIGIYANNRLRNCWRIATYKNITADELAARVHVLFTMENCTFAQISACVIASVVPSVAVTWKELCQGFMGVGLELNIKPLLVTNELNCGITVKTDQPEEVGADRLVNAAAAYHRYKQPLIVVDFGTAITLDCINARGEYLGGAIAPGVAISLDALHTRTAKLPRVDISTSPKNPIGRNTTEAIRSGILFGYAAMIKGLVSRMKKELGQEKTRVIATGGMAKIIACHCPSIDKVEPMLTMEGLRLIYELNS